MKKLIFIAMAAVIGLAGCQKEGKTGTEGEGKAEGITTLCATTESATKVAMIPGTAVEPAPAPTDVDQVIWKDGDMLKLYALKALSGGRGYELESEFSSTFSIVPANLEMPGMGPGHKTASFVLTQGDALDPAKTYVVLHSGNLDSFSASLNGTILCVRHIAPRIISPLVMDGFPDDDWCENAMAFYGVLRFADGEPQTISMESFTQIFEFHIKTASGVEAVELSNISMSVGKETILGTQFLKLDDNFQIMTEAAICLDNVVIELPIDQPVSVPANGAGEVVLRLPLMFRVSGEEVASQLMTLGLTSVENTTWNFDKTRTLPNGATSLFPGGTTYVVNLTIPDGEVVE